MDISLKERIHEVIESLRVYVNQDGGDLEFVDFKDGIVYIKILGACVGCEFVDITYKEGVETILMDEFQEIKEVQIIE